MAKKSLIPKSIHVFRSGTHEDSSGQSASFADSDLETTANVYDPSKHEAPLVIGHPAHDKPAYGWVDRVSFQSPDLFVLPKQVDSQFAEMVADGRFKKISASFYLPDAQANPVPGSYYLRHVGFLGAQPPAIKGLRNPEFNDDESQTVTIEVTHFSEDKEATVPTQETIPTPSAQPSIDYAELQRTITEQQSALIEKQKAFEQQQADFAEQQANFDTRQAELEARAEKLKVEEAKRQRQRIVDFVEYLACDPRTQKGKIPPRFKDGLVAFMSRLEPDALEFGEGNDAYKGTTQDWFKQFLTDVLPDSIDYGERSAPEEQQPVASVNYNIPEGTSFSEQDKDLMQRVIAYERQHNVTRLEALQAIVQ